MSDFLRPRELQHARLPYPSLSPGVCSNSVSIESVMPSNRLILCHPLLLYDDFELEPELDRELELDLELDLDLKLELDLELDVPAWEVGLSQRP